ncbi:MAG: putative Ig domain-containing protein [Rhodospirillaceae bacterium]|nr:putative Ig domain-containing protein [Rhodospirillales bacterium]
MDGEFRVNQTGNYSTNPAISALSDGRVVVTWTEYDVTVVPKNTGVFARIFGTAGNTAPTAAGVTNQNATEDSAFSYQVGAFTDPGDTLTYTATKSDGSALPTWLSFDSTTRTFSGTPDNGQVGTVAVKVTATDTANATATASFTITVANTNDAPVAATISNRNATEDAATTWQTPVFTDVDVGDTLTYSATLGDGSALPTWLNFDSTTRTFGGALPSWINFDAATRTFSGTPGTSDCGHGRSQGDRHRPHRCHRRRHLQGHGG